MNWYSQAGQDKWVIDTLGEDAGFFVDVGAYDGIEHSNTYALERYFDWTGVCIEPNPDAYLRLRDNRPGYVAQMAMSDHFGHVEFDGIRVSSGSPATACIPLANLLELFRAPPVIQYLSIDVEGHEVEVLAGMDFDRWDVQLLTVEHNLYCDGSTRKDAIANVLTGHGFVRVAEDVVAEGYGPYEDWWASADLARSRLA